MFKRKVFAYVKLVSSRHIRCYSDNLKNLQYSYSFMPGSIELTHSTVGQVLDNAAHDAGDKTAFVSPQQGIRKTFYELKSEADKLASGFLSLGLTKGDRIGLCASNMYEWPVTQFAAAKAGLILVTINPAYQAKELEYCLNKVGCKALVFAETFKTQNLYELLCSFIPELPNSKPGNLSSSVVQSLKSLVVISKNYEKSRSGTYTFEDVMTFGDSRSNEVLDNVQKLLQFDDPVNIQFTSGTTGSPKAAVLSHHNIVNNALIAGKRLRLDREGQIVCIQLPFYHCFGCVIGILASTFFKNPSVIPSTGFDAKASLQAIEAERCTIVYGAPTMFVDVMDKYDPSKHDLSSVQQVVVGGASSAENLLKELNNKLNAPLIQDGYGTTETSPAIATIDSSSSLSTVLSGYLRPLEFVEIKIIDGNGHLLPIGCEGEVCVRGPNVFLGYWDDKQNIAKAVDKTNWYHTGDLGKMDKNGRVKVIGRIKDMVLRGGENLYPVEIENYIHEHPSVLEVYICGVPDARMGEELCAWIKVKNGLTLTEADIKSFLKGKVSHFKIPRYILFVEDFPKTNSGKVQKFKMAETSKQLLGL